MRQIFGTGFLLLSLGLFVAAFQNCAVYKSSDKSGFEGNDAKPVSTSGSKALSAKAQAGEAARPCAGIIQEGDADAAFERPTDLADVVDAQSAPACMISSFENVADGADTAVCSSSAANYDLLRVTPEDDGRIVADPNPQGPMAEGSFGFARELADGRVEFVFVGANRRAPEAIACRFAYASRASFQASMKLAALRGSRLVRAIAGLGPSLSL